MDLFTSLPFTQEQIDKFWANVDKTPGLGSGDCWFWMGRRNKGGYGKVDGRRWQGQQLAHRVAYWVTHGSLTPGLNILHHCDNPCCVRAEHLYEGTHADNGRDKAVRGRAARHIGDLSGTSKLTWEKVREIRRKYNSEGVSILKLSKEYEVKKNVISGIIYGRNWEDSSYSPPKPDGKGEAKITFDDAVKMRQLYASGGWKLEDLGREFGLSRIGATRVIKNETFKDATYTPPVLGRPVFKGEQQTNSKLTQEKVNCIRALFAEGGTTRSQLAQQFEVSHKLISLVLANKAWRDDNFTPLI